MCYNVSLCMVYIILLNPVFASSSPWCIFASEPSLVERLRPVRMLRFMESVAPENAKPGCEYFLSEVDLVERRGGPGAKLEARFEIFGEAKISDDRVTSYSVDYKGRHINELLPIGDALYRVTKIRQSPRLVEFHLVEDAELIAKFGVNDRSLAVPWNHTLSVGDHRIRVDKYVDATDKADGPRVMGSFGGLITSTHERIALKPGDSLQLTHVILTVKKIVPPDPKINTAGWVEFIAQLRK